MAAAKHGTRQRYKQGCSCDPCKAAEAAYKREQRRRRNARNAAGEDAAPLAIVQAIIPKPATSATEPEDPERGAERQPGPVEAAIRAQLGALSTVEARAGEAEMAYALAKLLDNPKALPQHSAAAHRLSELIDKLRKGADKKTGKLAAVRKMTRPDQATG